MKLHRFFGDFDFSKHSVHIGESGAINQIRNVLRLKRGDELVLQNGKAEEARAMIVSIGREGVDCEIVSTAKNTNESGGHSVLYVAMLKRENFELVVQKATEVGIKEIVPLITERTVKLGFKKDRLMKIIREAVQQSGRGMAPALRDPVSFDGAVKLAEANDRNFFCDQSGEAFPGARAGGNIGIFVGPEGGWTEGERTEAKKAKFQTVALSAHTLRAETAAIIAAHLIAR